MIPGAAGRMPALRPAGVALAAGLALALAGCGRSKGDAVNVIGSTSVQPFAEMLAEEFGARNPGLRVEVQGGGSSQGVQMTIDGTAQLGMCSRDLKKEEIAQGLTPIQIARDGLAVIIHPGNAVNALTRQQIQKMFSGQTENWQDVGGPDRPVRLIVREEGSGTREAFVKMIMGKVRISRRALNQESNGAVKELVRNDPCAIGFMSLGLVTSELKAVTVDGVAPSAAAVKSGRYPLVRPFLFLTKGRPSPAAQKYIDFVLSPVGQQMLEREGLVGVK